MHDRKVFDNPEEFQPERYIKDGKLNPDVRDPERAAFGFGRRSANTTYSPTYTHSLIFDQYMSWKTPKRQLVIRNCILSSRGI